MESKRKSPRAWSKGVECAVPCAWGCYNLRSLCTARPVSRIKFREQLFMHNVVIIGSGCAGLTAAIYAARANLKPLILEGHEPGGQLSLTTHVENFPGFPDGILGPELIENMRKQAQKFGAEFKAGVVSEVDLTKTTFQDHCRKRSLRDPRPHCCSGSLGAASRAEGREGTDWPRVIHVCHLRWLLLPRERHCGDRRRRFRHGRGQFSFSVCQQGPLDPPARRIPRVENHD